MRQVLCTAKGLPVRLALIHFVSSPTIAKQTFATVMSCLPGHRRAAAIAGALVLKNRFFQIFRLPQGLLSALSSYGNVFISKLVEHDSVIEFGRIGGKLVSATFNFRCPFPIGWLEITNICETFPRTWPRLFCLTLPSNAGDLNSLLLLRTCWRTRAASWKTSAGGVPQMTSIPLVSLSNSIYS